MVVLAVMLLCTTPSRSEVQAADFKLDPPALVAPGTAHPADGAVPEDSRVDNASTPSAPPRYRLANGFGRDVPLSFAMRQVVPSHVQVVYDKEVDRSTLVNWQGGRPWIDVIRTTVRTVGLHVTVSPGIVRISN